MGQYLGIGIMTRLTIEKANIKKAKVSKNDLFEAMKNKFHLDVEIYNLTEDDEYMVLHLKDEVFQNQLVPMLEKLYPILYTEPEWQDALEKIKSTEPEKFMKLAENKSEEYFQLDRYGTYEYLSFKNSEVKISSVSILLSLEGKIIMETYGRQFNFFKYCIKQTLNEFSLANAIRVYITG